MSVLFIAGAGTDVGKTYLTTALIRGLRAEGREVRALKPVLSGAPAWDAPAFAQSDTARLLAAQGRALSRAEIEACSPWRFAAPLAPDAAAAREGRRVTLVELVDFHRSACEALASGATLLVEGVGGLMSPVAADATTLDWLQALDCPALLVAGDYLGAVSHALTACEALARRGVPLRGVVVSAGAEPAMPLAETRRSIARWCAAPVVTLAREAAFTDWEMLSL